MLGYEYIKDNYYFIHAYTYIHINMHMPIHTYMYICTHTSIHTIMYIHMYKNIPKLHSHTTELAKLLNQTVLVVNQWVDRDLLISSITQTLLF